MSIELGAMLFVWLLILLSTAMLNWFMLITLPEMWREHGLVRLLAVLLGAAILGLDVMVATGAVAFLHRD